MGSENSFSISKSENQNDYNSFSRILNDVHSVVSKSAVADSVIDQEDLQSCFDLERDHCLSLSDLQAMPSSKVPTLFGSLENLLTRHSYDVPFSIQDWDSHIDAFCQRGEAPEELLESKIFLEGAVKKDGSAIRYISPSTAGFEDLAELAIQQNPSAIVYVPPAFLAKSPKLVQLAAALSPIAVTLLPYPLQLYYSDVVCEAVLKLPPILLGIAPVFKITHPDLLRKVVMMSGIDLKYIGTAAQLLFPDIALKAVYNNPSSIYSVATGLKESESFQIKMIMSNFNVFGELRIMFSSGYLSYIWKKVCDQLREQGLYFPQTMLSSYEDFIAGLKKSGLTNFPGRIREFKTAFELMQNKMNPFDPNDKRPVALFLYNSDDYNSAFDNYPAIDEFVKNGFKVIYREISSDTEYFDYLDYYSKNGDQPFHTLVIGGHGARKLLQFSTKPTGGPSHLGEGDLDYNDFKECPVKSPIQPGGQILVYACGNARGYSFVENLSNAIGSTYPNDITVIGQPVTGNIKEMSFDEDHHLSIKFWVGTQDPLSNGMDVYDVIDAYVQQSGEQRTLGLMSDEEVQKLYSEGTPKAP